MSRLVVILCASVVVMPVHALEWENLWSSPEQRAKKKLDAQEYDALIEQAPDALWRGLGEYQNGDYSAAAQSFAEQREQVEQTEHQDAFERASFNQATSLVKAGEYDQAINLYDDILSTNPEHQNALANRDIAEQLQELQQQQEQQQDGDDQNQSDSEDSQNSEQQDESSESGEDSQDSSEQSDEQSSQQNDQQSSDQSDDETSEQGESLQDESEQKQAEEEAQAAKAMQAEQERQPNDEEQQNAQSSAVETRPLTEREQANEQWLRQIPDDPAGLLERKIQNRHATDFPKVEHSDKPW